MEQTNVNENLENKSNDYDFHDLEALLQQGLGNPELKVIDYRTENLLPVGENYSSLVIKIDATICKKDGAENEDLHLVAKAKSPIVDHLEPWVVGTTREIFLYSELLPMYKDIEREAGIPENELIDVVPKYMGHRKSFEQNGAVDKDSLILMENMIVKGYYNFDRHTGLDLEHAKKALTSLARYHALGIAMKLKRPSFAQIAIKNAEAKLTEKDIILKAFDTVRNGFQNNSQLNIYMDIIESSIAYMTNTFFSLEEKPVGQWDSINHGDFWTNNMLFHKNDKGQVDDIKFVDWSWYSSKSALADVPYFFCTSVQKVILDQHFDDLLDLYYKSFVRSLERISCGTTMFTRDSFDAELKKQAINEIAFSALAVKFINYQVKEGDEKNKELHKSIFESEADYYAICLMKIIEVYKARKWL